jgi:replication-associated recombination protein RarA
LFESIFKKGIDNLRFALNLDGYVPEHIVDELRFKHNFPNDDKDLGEKDRFNSNTELIFSKITSVLEPKSSYDGYKQPNLFGGIVGHDDLKKLLTKCLAMKDNCNVLLSGPPASSKTIFLLSIQNEVSNACFIDAANASGPGLVDHLFEHPNTQVICVDELDKLKKSDQTALLNLLELGILASMKVRKRRTIRMEGVKVFATSNDVDKLIEPLKSRFLKLELPEYTWEDFLEITQKLLHSRHGLDVTISAKIAQVVWSQLRTKDIRDVLTIAKLTNSSEDVDFIAATLQKYQRTK